MKKTSPRDRLMGLLRLCVRDLSGSGRLLNLLLMALNERSRQSFYTFHHRPKRHDDIHLDPPGPAARQVPRAGVVVQGPIVRRDDFTIESARLYRHLMPQTEIIVSTWEADRHPALDALRDEGIHVVYSTPPRVSGANNINFQIRSTQAGIRKARELGCEHVLKSRSDQRFHAGGLQPYFCDLMTENPPAHPLRQRQRVIELSLNICRYRPYSMCDMFQYGHIDDLERMWGVADDPRSITVAEYSRQVITARKISTDRIAEIYVHRAYLEAIGDDPTVDLAAYYRILGEYFIVIDKDEVDLFWNKYHAREQALAENPVYGPDRAKARFYHRDWVTLRHRGVQAFNTDPALLDRVER